LAKREGQSQKLNGELTNKAGKSARMVMRSISAQRMAATKLFGIFVTRPVTCLKLCIYANMFEIPCVLGARKITTSSSYREMRDLMNLQGSSYRSPDSVVT
jgi:hypothetical protein